MTNEKAILQFAKSFAPDVIILEPKSLAEKVSADLKTTLEMYGK